MNKCKQKMKKGEGKRKTIKRTMIRRKKRKRRSRRKYILKGGKPIAAGSYGCVFKPSLKYTDCNDKSSSDFRVSKVFINETELNNEWDEISSIKTAFEKIPKESLKVDDYFIYDASKCSIDYSDTINKTQLDKARPRVCSNIIKGDSAHYISNYPQALDSKYGGIDFKEYLDSKGWFTFEQFKRLNSKMIELFDAIVAMNNANIYHFDIKAENMVYDENEEKLRLIDFGFAKVFDQPDLISVDYNGPKFLNTVTKLQYNNEYIRIKFSGTLCYASVFGSYLLDKDWDDYASVFGSYFLDKDLEDKYLDKTLKRWGWGEVVAEISSPRSLPPARQKKVYLDSLIHYYYTNKDDLLKIIKLNLKKILNKSNSLRSKCQSTSLTCNSYKQIYFKTVFLHNSDIFAFLMIYLNINVDDDIVTKSIKYLIDKYILTDDYATEPYNIEMIRSDLKFLTRRTGPKSYKDDRHNIPRYSSRHGSRSSSRHGSRSSSRHGSRSRSRYGSRSRSRYGSRSRSRSRSRHGSRHGSWYGSWHGSSPRQGTWTGDDMNIDGA